MSSHKPSIFVVLMLLSTTLSGCVGSPEAEETERTGSALVEVENPCSVSTQSTVQTTISIFVEGQERLFRLTVPESTVGTPLPLVIAFHGGGGAEEDFQQQNQFDQLAEEEDFIMAYAIAESDRTVAEGEWYLNTAATSRDDNDFALQIVNELSSVYCVDQDRLYAIGYSLGSMFTYEVACQLNHRFAAVASFAGTMPVNPESCTLFGNMAVLHVHGKLDYIIDYDEDWDWKDGEHEGVGTMSDVPGMIDFWAQLSNCEDDNTHSHLFGGDDVEHVVHSDCDGDVRIELYGMEAQEHTWPEQVDGTDTYRLMWNFLSGFTN